MSTKKKTLEEVKEKFKERNLYLFDNQEYINSKLPLKCYDKNGYWYYLSLGNVSDKRTKSFEIVSRLNIFAVHNIQKYINDNGYNTKVLSKEYNGEKEDLILQCECGKIYKQHWNHIKSMNMFTCVNCGVNRRVKKQTYSLKKAKEICNNNGYSLIEETYINAHDLSVIDKYGYKYKTTLYNLRDRTNNFNRFHKTNPYTIENMCLYIKLNNIPIELVDKTKRTINIKNDYIEFYCLECGKPFKVTWQQVKEGRYRCKKCYKRQSNLEYIVEQYLINNNIKYTEQKRFNGCINKRMLPFDFYLDDYNYVLEINGGQHYYENKIFSQSLEERQRLDKIKKDYCKNNNIGYVAIPFWYIKNGNINSNKYKEIINNILSQK